MERVAKLVSRTPPEGLTDWAPVRDDLEYWGLVYEAVWVQDNGLDVLLDEFARPRKRKAVEVRCSCCGESRIMPWGKTDKQTGGYGFLQQDELNGETVLVASGGESVCPICGEPVRVKKAAEIGCGYFVADETHAMSAAVVGADRYLTLTGWTVQRRVYRNARAELKTLPAEAYVFSREDCRKLMGWRNNYSGTIGYFYTYCPDWREPERWNESYGPAAGIYGLTPELVAGSCLSNCKLDVYMKSFRTEKLKYPVMYLRLYQVRSNVENLLVSGLPMVLDDLLDEVYSGFRWQEDNIRGNISMALAPMSELNWNTPVPSRMLGLTREELRLGREQCWGLFLWRLFIRTRDQGELLTGEDMRDAALLGDRNLLELIGHGPVRKTIRYVLRQYERYDYVYNDPYVSEEDYEELEEVVPGLTPDVTTLLDYWAACRELGRNLEENLVRYPRNLIEAHDEATTQLIIRRRAIKNGSLAHLFRIRRRLLAKYIFEADGLKIVPAWSEKELQQEGDVLHHCVAGYAQSHASGKTAIFFIRRTVEPQKPYYTLELDEDRLAVRQNRGLRNCGKTAVVQAFEDLWISWIRDGAKRDERGRPILSKLKDEVKGA